MKLSAANGPCRLPWLLQIRNTFVLLCFINSKEREIGGYLGHREIGGYLGQAKIVVIMVGKFSSWCSLTLGVLLVPFRVAHHCQYWHLAWRIELDLTSKFWPLAVVNLTCREMSLLHFDLLFRMYNMTMPPAVMNTCLAFASLFTLQKVGLLMAA